MLGDDLIKPRKILQRSRAALHQFDAVKQHPDPEYGADGIAVAHRFFEGEAGSGNAEQVQDCHAKVQHRHKYQRRRPHVAPGDDRQSPPNGDQSAGNHAGKDKRDGRGALQDGPGDDAKQGRLPEAVGQSRDERAQAPACHLLEVAADKLQAGKKQAHPCGNHSNDVNHGLPERFARCQLERALPNSAVPWTMEPVG